MTWKTDRENYEKCKNGLDQLTQELSNNSFETKRANWRDYSGWMVGNIFVGDRHDSTILRATGSDAKTAAAEIRKRKIAGRATRFDLQITAKDEKCTDDYGERVFAAYRARAAASNASAKTNLAHYYCSGRDCGFTIGARCSQRYCRFYNKTVEQRGKVDDGLWRYEVEFKGEQARYIWSCYENSVRDYWLALGVVAGEFQARGVDMSFVSTGQKYERKSEYKRSSVQKSLNWLQNNVRQTVLSLIEAGYEDAVYEALGLDKN